MDPRLIALTGLLAGLLALSVWSFRRVVAEEEALLAADRAADESAAAVAARVAEWLAASDDREARRMAARVEAVLSPRVTCSLCDGRVPLLQLVEWYDGADWLCPQCVAVLDTPRSREAA